MDMRPEVEQSRINIESSKIGLVGTKNALKPTIDAFGSFQNNGASYTPLEGVRGVERLVLESVRAPMRPAGIGAHAPPPISART